MDRTQEPKNQPLEKIQVPIIQKYKLNNGIPVTIVPFGKQEVIEIQVVFQTGGSYESKKDLVNVTAEQMMEGTKTYNSKELSDILDFYGAFINHESGYEITSYKLSCLTKHLESTISIFEEVLFTPTFPEEEFQIWKMNRLQQCQVDEKSTSWYAGYLFLDNMIGKHHPYGQKLDRQAVENIQYEDLKKCWEEEFNFNNAYLLVSGKFDNSKVENILNQVFGTLSISKSNRKSNAEIQEAKFKSLEIRQSVRDGIQSTIRMGRLCVQKNHPDSKGLELLGTIFGGYFGSRLMKNIREEKGYTYGIYGNFVFYKHLGYLLIATDVGNEYVDATLSEVRKEMIILQNELIPEEELEVAKNYYLGGMLSDMETPFQIADLIKSYELNNQEISQIETDFETIQNITSNDLQVLAKKYLNIENLLTVICS